MRDRQKLRGFSGPNERGLRMTIPNVRASNPNDGKLDYATKSMTVTAVLINSRNEAGMSLKIKDKKIGWDFAETSCITRFH
jgi:hypothetical protein